MKIGRKAFLSRNPLDEDLITWYYNDEPGWVSGIFTLGVNRTIVSLHTPTVAKEHEHILLPGFIDKLALLSKTLKAAATHVAGQVMHTHIRLNPEAEFYHYMTGYVAWGDNGEEFYVTVGDCQRAWRMAISHNRPHGGKTLRLHQRKLMTMIRHIDQAIKELKDVQ